VIADRIDHRAPPRQEGTIRLVRAGTTPAVPRSAVEQYSRCDEWLRHFSLLLYGDRFYEILSVPAECSLADDWFESACGPLVREGGVLRFKVERARKIKRDDDTWHLDDLHPVPWGERLYLVSQSQWVAFCNAVNQGEEPRSND
jgi:hypothetical protein